MQPVSTSVRLSRLALLLALVLTLPEAGPGPVAPRSASAPSLTSRFVLAWGRHGKRPGEFDFPIGIAVDRAGDVFVTDFYNARVQRFSPKGEPLSAFAVLPNPGGIALGPGGELYLTHFSAMRLKEVPKPDRVSVYTRHGKLLRQWGKTGTGPGEFDYPGGIAVGPGGRVYVADQTNRRVQSFDLQGKFLFTWGKFGTATGEFGGNVAPRSRVGGPQFVVIDAEGDVYTTEGSMGRVQRFTADGKFVLAWGDNGEGPGGFGGPWMGRKGAPRGPVGVCVVEKGRVWVSAASGRIQAFTREGKYLGRVDSGEGSKPGQFLAPHGVASDGRGHLYVVDAYNHRVQKFAVGP